MTPPFSKAQTASPAALVEHGSKTPIPMKSPPFPPTGSWPMILTQRLVTTGREPQEILLAGPLLFARPPEPLNYYAPVFIFCLTGGYVSVKPLCPPPPPPTLLVHLPPSGFRDATIDFLLVGFPLSPSPHITALARCLNMLDFLIKAPHLVLSQCDSVPFGFTQPHSFPHHVISVSFMASAPFDGTPP